MLRSEPTARNKTVNYNKVLCQILANFRINSFTFHFFCLQQRKLLYQLVTLVTEVIIFTGHQLIMKKQILIR